MLQLSTESHKFIHGIALYIHFIYILFISFIFNFSFKTAKVQKSPYTVYTMHSDPFYSQPSTLYTLPSTNSLKYQTKYK